MSAIKFKSNSVIGGKIYLELEEGEARALEAICGYGPDAFVKWFYKNLGEHYLKPHEDAMRSLFATVRAELPKHLSKLDKARKFFKDLDLKSIGV